MSKHIQFALWNSKNCVAFIFSLQFKKWIIMADAWSVWGKTQAPQDDLVSLRFHRLIPWADEIGTRLAADTY